jgi:hypothetical protein
MAKPKRFNFIVLALVLVGLVAATALVIKSLESSKQGNVALKKDLGRTLEITPGDLVSLNSGSDAGGCSWDPSKTEDAFAFKKAVERLLRMSAFEMNDEAPEGCKAAYYAADDINSFKFVTGQLTIPPSGQYPPSPTGTFSHFYRVVFQKNDQSAPREFCLEEADFVAVVATIKENPKLVDCEF